MHINTLTFHAAVQGQTKDAKTDLKFSSIEFLRDAVAVAFLLPVPCYLASCFLFSASCPADCCATVSEVNFINSHFFL